MLLIHAEAVCALQTISISWKKNQRTRHDRRCLKLADKSQMVLKIGAEKTTQVVAIDKDSA